MNGLAGEYATAALEIVYRDVGARSAAMMIWDVVQMSRTLNPRMRVDYDSGERRWRYDSLCSWISYGQEHWSRSRRTLMDVEALVAKWVPIVKGLAAAHTKEELDRCEFESEQHLGPLLTAPVKQAREFFAKLCDALRADPTVPMFVWSAFDAWHEVVLKKAPDEGVKQLKTQLAIEVADLVEAQVQPDLKAALVGAIQWRSAEQLTRVRDSVKGGAKASLKGRESCLFLVAGEATVML